MLEKDIVNAIMRYLKTVPECFSWKTHGGLYGVAGLPDIICCYHGKFVAFEVKTPAGRPTKLQDATMRRIQKAGGRALVVRNINEVKSILSSSEVVSNDNSMDVHQ